MSDQNLSSVPTLSVEASENTTPNSVDAGAAKPRAATKAAKKAAPKKRGFFSRLLRKLFLLIVLFALLFAGIFWAVQKYFPQTANNWKELAVNNLPESWSGYTPKIRDALGLTSTASAGVASAQGASDTAQPVAAAADTTDSVAETPKASESAPVSTATEAAATAAGEPAETVTEMPRVVASETSQPVNAAVQTELSALREETARLSSLIEGFSSVTGQKQAIQLNEVEYLVKMANQHLSLTKNVPGAVGLLESADKVLSETRGIDVIPARKALAASVQALEKAGSVDVEKLFFSLGALEQQVAQFEFAAVPQEQQTTDAAANDSAEAETVVTGAETQTQTFLTAVGGIAKDMVSKAVRVREVAEINPLLDAHGQLAAKQNLMLLISQAKIALLQRQAGAYQASLTQAKGYIQTLSSLKNDGMAQATALLDEVAAVNISPELPDLTPTLAAVTALVNKSQKQLARQGGAVSPQAPQASEKPLAGQKPLASQEPLAEKEPSAETGQDETTELVTEGQVL